MNNPPNPPGRNNLTQNACFHRSIIRLGAMGRGDYICSYCGVVKEYKWFINEEKL